MLIETHPSCSSPYRPVPFEANATLVENRHNVGSEHDGATKIQIIRLNEPGSHSETPEGIVASSQVAVLHVLPLVRTFANRRTD